MLCMRMEVAQQSAWGWGHRRCGCSPDSVAVKSESARALQPCSMLIPCQSTMSPPLVTLIKYSRQHPHAHAASAPLLVLLLLVTGFGDDGGSGGGVKTDGPAGRRPTFGITGTAAAAVLGVPTVKRELCVGVYIYLCLDCLPLQGHVSSPIPVCCFAHHALLHLPRTAAPPPHNKNPNRCGQLHPAGRRRLQHSQRAGTAEHHQDLHV